MDRARDHQGNLVYAWEVGISRYGFVCPNPSCNEPVMIRSGPERQPHFAHYSHRAKPDCENYFPSLGTNSVSGVRRQIDTSSTSPFKRESLRCGLFFVERTSFDLQLRIPPVARDGIINGSVSIKTGLGIRTYTAAQLQKSYLIPLAPQVPLADCSGTGELTGLADYINVQLYSFISGINIFTRGENSGRLIFTDEPLEWGNQYRLLTNSAVEPPVEIYSFLEWNSRGKLRGWHIYDIDLPSSLSSTHSEVWKLISVFLGRKIRTRRPRAYVIKPAPHHIDSDGTYVYPLFPEYLLIRRTADLNITIDTTQNSLINVTVKELSGRWVEAEGLHSVSQEVTISIDGNEQALLRVEDCTFSQSIGIQAYTDELSWDLVKDAPFSLSELFHKEVHIECNNMRVAEHLSKMNDSWSLEGTILSASRNIGKTFVAGGFGGIGIGGKEEAGKKQESGIHESSYQYLPMSTWIEGLVGIKFGQKGVNLVKAYLVNSDQINLARLGSIATSPLMPYIRVASNKQKFRER